MPERESIEEGDENEDKDISDNQIIQDVRLRPFFFLEILVRDNPTECDQEELLEI